MLGDEHNALARFLEGYINPPDWQPADVKGDAQLSVLRAILSRTLTELDVNTTIIDIGAGRGVLIPVLSSIEAFQKGEQHYLGIDVDLNPENIAVSLDAGLLTSGRAQYMIVKTCGSD